MAYVVYEDKKAVRCCSFGRGRGAGIQGALVLYTNPTNQTNRGKFRQVTCRIRRNPRCISSDGRPIHADFTEVCRRFTEVHRHFTEVCRRFTGVHRHFTEVRRRFTEVYRHFTKVYRRFTEVYRHFMEVFRQ